MLKKFLTSRQLFYSLIVALLAVFVIGIVNYVEAATAPQPTTQAAQMHPAFSLLDASEQNVLTSRKPISTSKTCGACHDTAFITTHSFHADLGYSESKPIGQITNGHEWDTSTGLYGKWNPLTYRYLSPNGDAKIDLTPAEWLKVNAARIVGGGPAEKATGLEMDCFLCHFTNPNNPERVAAIQSNNVAWANTASLVGTGIVEKNKDQYTYNANAFNSKGELQRAFITIQDPNNNNCAQCHGLVHNAPNPLTNTGRDLTQWQTATTGQIVSAQKISQ